MSVSPVSTKRKPDFPSVTHLESGRVDGEPRSGPCDLGPAHVTITPGCSDDDDNWACRRTAGMRPPTGKNHGGSGKYSEKTPSNTGDQPRGRRAESRKIGAWRPVEMSGASTTDERGESGFQVVRGLAPLHPEPVEDKGKRTGKEEQGSSTRGSPLESTCKGDQEFPGPQVVGSG